MHDLALDRAAPAPIGDQLAARLRAAIAGGAYLPGQRLPTEHDLCRDLGVSRTTVRRALGRLTAEGLLIRHAGRGTFVAPPPPPPSEEPPAVAELVVTVPNERRLWLPQQAAAAWNAAHPERPVRLHFRVTGSGMLYHGMSRAIGRGEAGDIALVDSAWVAEYAARGYLEPFADADPELAAAIDADLMPAIRAQNAWRGEGFALPAEVDFSGLWFRKDWFAAEHIAPPTTWTWDEMRAALARFATARARRRYALGPFPLAFAGGAAAAETATFQLLGVLWAAGAEIFAQGEVVLDGAAARAAVAFVADLVNADCLAPPEVVDEPSNGAALAFAAGSVAMALGGTYEGTLIRAAAGWDDATFRQRAGFLPVPAGPDGAPVSVLGGLSWVVSRQSRQPGLALALLQRAAQPDLLLPAARESGQSPATLSATAALDPAADPELHAAATLFAHARPRPPIPEYARVSEQLTHMFESAIRGEATPARAVAEAAMVIAGIAGLPRRGQRARPELAGAA